MPKIQRTVSSMATYYENIFHHINKQVVKKLKDNNRLRSNAENPHHRIVTLYNIPKLPFAWLFGTHFRHDDVYVYINPTVPLNFRSVQMTDFKLQFDHGLCYVNHFHLQCISTDSLLKIHNSGDCSLLTPWLSFCSLLSVRFAENRIGTFESGHLVLPLKEFEDKVQVFFVCGGLNDDGTVPEWGV